MKIVTILGLEEKLSQLPLSLTYSEELGLDLYNPEDRFKWFIASILFAKRISTKIAKKTYRRFEEEKLTTPEKILAAGWNRLVEVLDSGGYVRYDFSTASNLIRVMEELKKKYGDLEELYRKSSDPIDLERRLQEFRGVGPVGVNIFLRELRDVESYESVLVRLNLEFCKRHKCDICPVQTHCDHYITEFRADNLRKMCL